MKALNILELDSLVEAIGSFEEAELQSVVVSKREFALRFHSGKQGFWLVVDMNPQCPAALFLDTLSVELMKAKSPIGLFLSAHFVGRSIKSAERVQQYGRVVRLHLSEERLIELRLFPHGQNLILKTPDKSMSFQKASALEAIVEEHAPLEARSLAEIGKQWVESKKKMASATVKEGARSTPSLTQSLKKLKRSLSKLEADIGNKESQRWREAGEWLAQNQTLSGAPALVERHLDFDRNFAWNLENCFEKAKKTEQKLETVRIRRSEVKKELETLSEMNEEEYLLRANEGTTKGQAKFKLSTKLPLKTRKLELGSGASVFVGKSAKDNLQLLRKARAWDYWFHIKDVPSAHAILFRNKGQMISESEIAKAAQFLLKTSRDSSKDSLLDEAVEVLMAEKRFVQPIKGDKHGRVTHRNAKTIRVQVKN
ncbi:MAG: hypothetical protein AAF202_02700 [Pseudomonadota bacterium]